MFNIIETTIDITKYPQIIAKETKPQQITLGDLHGNTLLLLHTLIQKGIITISEENYLKFVEIYTRTNKGERFSNTGPNKVTQNDINDFKIILSTISLGPQAHLLNILLIGDEVADRGSNDYFTLKLLEKLVTNNIDVKILLSNHGMELLAYSHEDEDIGGIYSNFLCSHILDEIEAASLSRLRNCVDDGTIEKSEVLALIKNIYHPTLKALSYTLDHETNSIAIYTHAPVPLEIITRLATQFGVDYKDDTIDELAKTIDAINTVIAKQIPQKDFYEKNYSAAGFLDPTGNSNLKGCDVRFYSDLGLKLNPLIPLTWHRDTFVEYAPFIGRQESSCGVDWPTARPHHHKGYKVYYVHGHSEQGKVPAGQEDFVCNLDQLFGKTEALFAGQYKCLMTKPSDKPLEKNLHQAITSEFSAEPITSTQDSPRPRFG